ncbi:pyridoxamine 5'-phosphate oxidase family protein [Aquabacterium sp. OR-4]|uniref:pyridoxamine 5'-phosphate oxidase family protein n=1 Tax=Aquabacterium sp. OR-4 TaxID=2978127 RepID=UPI0021B286AD|nr:pyridoxamine 5'-phosphate oxidase family protein [Aquabacterium sp. OR-4]MDT7834468.1 pyridoxamine 5'-phosphate oxidase family protein [Aquabacterium sp. OR-4]
MTERLTSLDRIHAACWQELEAATRTRGHGWRLLALASLAPPDHAGEPPVADVRTVVLREVQADARQLVIYTDSRSPKLAQIRSQPQVTAMCWSPALSWQLRLRARLTVDTDGLGVSSRWARLKMHPSAQDYLSPLPPGAALDTPAQQAPPAPDRGSREFFAVIFATVERIDWLELHAEGHRRAVFDDHGAGHWVTP